jgi:hypothetical protein
MIKGWRLRLSTLLQTGEAPSLVSGAVKVLLIALIMASVAALALETVEEIASRYGSMLALVDVVTVGVLTVEYALRLWIAPELEPTGPLHPFQARLRYGVSAFHRLDGDFSLLSRPVLVPRFRLVACSPPAQDTQVRPLCAGSKLICCRHPQ